MELGNALSALPFSIHNYNITKSPTTKVVRLIFYLNVPQATCPT